jgi:hypothetical protein
MDLFVEKFKLNTEHSTAKFLAYNIEASINRMHSAISDYTLYIKKAQSLAFSLLQNDVRYNVLN